jgi:hypothetical protein
LKEFLDTQRPTGSLIANVPTQFTFTSCKSTIPKEKWQISKEGK